MDHLTIYPVTESLQNSHQMYFFFNISFTKCTKRRQKNALYLVTVHHLAMLCQFEGFISLIRELKLLVHEILYEFLTFSRANVFSWKLFA